MFPDLPKRTSSDAAPAGPGRTWTREAIERFLAEEDIRYQRIELPHGLATGGGDRSAVARLIFPDDLTGKSVLDVGCYSGFYCLEAWQRGARRVLGVDLSRDHVRQARAIAEMRGAAVEYRRLDIEAELPDERFDYVLFLNVLHHCRRPVAALDRLISLTEERLVLQVAGLEDENARRRLRRLGADWYVRRKLPRLPLVFVGKGGVEEKAEEQFYFTSPALLNLLMRQRQAFARIEARLTPIRHRRLLIAHRRRVGRLLLVAGPLAAGKTTLAERLRRGEAPEIAGALDLGDPSGWAHLDPERRLTDERIWIERLIFEYDTNRPWRRDGGTHARDEALEVLDGARERRVALALAPARVLLGRLDQEIERAERRKGKPSKRLRALRRLYERPERLAEVIEDWLSFCEQRRLAVTLIDATAEPRLRPLDAWPALLEG